MNNTQLQGINTDSLNKNNQPLRPPSPPKQIEISKNMHKNDNNGSNDNFKPKNANFSEYENNGQGMSTPVKLNYMNNNSHSNVQDNPTLHMSAK